jgi:pimeloyl-ACP methyl ester carboxylesterase
MIVSRRNLFFAGGALAAAAAETIGSAAQAQDAPTPNQSKKTVPALQSPNGWARSVISKGDIRLEVFQKGEGISVLMHPSLGRPAQDFEDLGNRVAAAGYLVVLINPRGIGDSTGPLENATLRDLGADVWMIADALKIDRAFVLGQNFGNRVSRTVSSLQPDRVIGLMLLAAGGEIGPDKEVWAEFGRVFDPSLSPERHLQAVAHSFFAPGNDATLWKDGWFGKTAELQTEAAKRTDFSQIYFGGTARTLVIQGMDDVIAPAQNAWNFVGRRPNARLVAFPNMGHAMLPEQPEAIADAVIDFIKSQPAADYGDDLYGIVREYSGHGIDRVGTPVDTQTIAWFVKQLENRGGKVEQQPFTFDRFDGTSAVIIDGREVSSLPLFYEGIGEVETDAPFVAAVNAMTGDRNSKALLDAIAQAKASGAKAAVIATENPFGLLQTPNREPKIASGLPTVLVPGSAAAALRSGKVHLRYSAKIVKGESANVLATFGDTSKKPIVIATPLSGWFTCAAERGTGIAIALGLAQRLAPNHPVTVVGASGHEILHHIGLEAFLERNKLDPAIVIHLGANVALGTKDPKTGQIRLAPGIDDPAKLQSAGRTLFVRMRPQTFATLRPVLAEADLTAILNPPKWNGEGELWAGAVKSPLMSFTGIGPLFHTPGDVPDEVTGPMLLNTVYLALGKAIDVFMT